MNTQAHETHKTLNSICFENLIYKDVHDIRNLWIVHKAWSSCSYFLDYFLSFLPSSSKALVIDVKVGFFLPGIFFSISAFDSE